MPKENQPVCLRTWNGKRFRFHILNRAGRIAWRKGIKVIELTKNNNIELLYKEISTAPSDVEIKKAA